jgi:hypothetical protein
VISLDGTEVAWVTSTGKVQIVTYGTGATIAGGDESVSNPVCIGSVLSGGDGASLQSVTLANAVHNPTSVSVSAIFVDYNSDSAYVGDNDGYLHKISPFFTATGALQEITTPAWQPSYAYSVGALIVDSNGFIEQCTTAGTSGTSQPPWGTVWQSTSPRDGGANGVTWTNMGSGGGWPVYVTGSSSNIDSVALNGPIFDIVSSNVFVGDRNGSLYYVLDPPSSTVVGSCANGYSLYPCLGSPGTPTPITPAAGVQTDCADNVNGFNTCLVMSNQQGFIDSVAVDSSDSLVIMQFSNADGHNAAVEQTNTSLGVFNSATLAGQLNIAYHSGDFDNNYFNNPTTGYYYVCGPDSDGMETDLYRVGFTSAAGAITLGSVNGTPLKLTTSGNSGNCSPLTEIYNTSTAIPKDWLFFSLDNNGKFPSATMGCADGSCVLSFRLEDTTGFMSDQMVTGPHNIYGSGDGGIAGMNGTGGMIVDNEADVVTYGQASSIYFMPVANDLTCGDGTSGTGCAVKLTQAGLR